MYHMYLHPRRHDETITATINSQTMFFTQANSIIVTCAWVAKVILTERYPKICGIDISLIIDKAVEFFQYSIRTSGHLVTTTFNTLFPLLLCSIVTAQDNKHNVVLDNNAQFYA